MSSPLSSLHELTALSSRFLSCGGVLKKQLQERKYIIWQNALNMAMIEKVRGDFPQEWFLE